MREMLYVFQCFLFKILDTCLQMLVLHEMGEALIIPHENYVG